MMNQASSGVSEKGINDLENITLEIPDILNMKSKDDRDKLISDFIEDLDLSPYEEVNVLYFREGRDGFNKISGYICNCIIGNGLSIKVGAVSIDDKGKIIEDTMKFGGDHINYHQIVGLEKKGNKYLFDAEGNLVQ